MDTHKLKPGTSTNPDQSKAIHAPQTGEKANATLYVPSDAQGKRPKVSK